ncbi:glycosyltransferase [Streptomyces sp. WAC05858]|uniref:glycosyltransferase family 8 protein n=1 Tax=Streptomyces TaxID=1883 RepID=UPI00163CEA06|nr:glycosyltransferase [Streptomyces sp. WAC05858]WTB04023.1 hypothetical protein OG546_07130 [Streptomyces antimycoticus]
MPQGENQSDGGAVVCVCVDDNYAPGALVALKSAKQNTMAVDCGLSKESIDAFRASISDVVIMSGDFSETRSGLAKATQNETLTHAMYGRLLAPEIVPARTRRLVYIDADMLVVDSLEPLFTMNLHEGVGAVEDTWVDPDHARALVGADSSVPWNHRSYLKSGVLVIDVAIWRSRQVSEYALDYVRARPKLRSPDQDALNMHTLYDSYQQDHPVSEEKSGKEEL